MAHFPRRVHLVHPDIHSDGLDVEIVVDAVTRPFPSVSRLLHAPKRMHLGREHARVDSHHAVLETLGRTPCTLQILCEQIPGVVWKGEGELWLLAF